MLACDGVWDVMSNQEVVQFVSVCLDSGMSLESIASQLLDACLAPDPRETRGIGVTTPCPRQDASHSDELMALNFQHGGQAAVHSLAGNNVLSSAGGKFQGLPSCLNLEAVLHRLDAPSQRRARCGIHTLSQGKPLTTLSVAQDATT